MRLQRADQLAVPFRLGAGEGVVEVARPRADAAGEPGPQEQQRALAIPGVGQQAAGLSFGTRVNGPISTMAVTSCGACAAAMVAEPPEKECPTMTAGPPRCLIRASVSAAVSVRV